MDDMEVEKSEAVAAKLDLGWMSGASWALIAHGEGAACEIVTGADIPRALHDFMCFCRSPVGCDVAIDVLKEMSDPDYWSTDEAGKRFSYRMSHECGGIEIVRVDGCHGAQMIAAERERQIRVEGYSPAHDAQYDNAQLLRAAAAYLEVATDQTHPCSDGYDLKGPSPEVWPWSDEWWKPSPDPIRNLEKAGALIAAEIDRLRREKEGAQAREAGDA